MSHGPAAYVRANAPTFARYIETLARRAHNDAEIAVLTDLLRCSELGDDAALIALMAQRFESVCKAYYAAPNRNLKILVRIAGMEIR